MNIKSSTQRAIARPSVSINCTPRPPRRPHTAHTNHCVPHSVGQIEHNGLKRRRRNPDRPCNSVGNSVVDLPCSGHWGHNQRKLQSVSIMQKKLSTLFIQLYLRATALSICVSAYLDGPPPGGVGGRGRKNGIKEARQGGNKRKKVKECTRFTSSPPCDSQHQCHHLHVTHIHTARLRGSSTRCHTPCMYQHPSHGPSMWHAHPGPAPRLALATTNIASSIHHRA